MAPALRVPLLFAQKVLDFVHSVATYAARAGTARWRRRWTASADAIADLIAASTEPGPRDWEVVRRSVEKQLRGGPPRWLRGRHMRLPSGYRSQDLAHHDATALADLVADSRVHGGERVLVVGPRSMGAYFAPAVAARLRRLGWTSVAWCTVRPKDGLSAWEQDGLRRHGVRDALVLVPDESPNTGNAFRLMVRMLRQEGVPPDKIILLAAMHPARPEWRPSPDDEAGRDVTLLRLDANLLYKHRLLEPATVQPLLRTYFRAAGWDDVEVMRSPETRTLDAQLDEHFQDGFQCRLKRVFEVRLRKQGDSAPAVQRVFAKSVGWGWLGYHAYLAGRRLAGFVPETYGLRDGVLFTEWLEAKGAEAGEGGARPPVDLLARYAAARVRTLPLPEDPVFAVTLRYDWTGWRVLVDTLRRALGTLYGRLKMSAVHRHLQPFVSPAPALIDGAMTPADWVPGATGFRKVDFEHHNFGRTELCIVDAAYDLAMATLEFQLTPAEEQELLRHYVDASGDAAVGDRIPLYKLLRATVVMSHAGGALAKESRVEALRQPKRRFWAARNDLVHYMNRLSASLLPDASAPVWTRRVFFMDLDGVFDSDVFGFPQTTRSGLLALALLRAHGFSVVLNTARGVVDGRQYCEAYRLPGAVAESGCIFLDAVRGRELSLVEPRAAEQLARCREAVQSLPGVFVDPNYTLAIRACRFTGERADGLQEAEIRALLGRSEFDQLTFAASSADTTFLPLGIGKGPGARWVRQYLELGVEPIAAVGDHDQDVELLRDAEEGYAPANASRRVRALAEAGLCRMTRLPRQRGLLEAARRVVHPDGERCERCEVRLGRATGSGILIRELADITERSRVRRLLSLLDWRGL